MTIFDINKNYFIDESAHLEKCAKIAKLTNDSNIEISKRAHKLIKNIKSSKGTIESFMKQYSLSNNEGIMLMCLAEALLRIPDKNTANELIKDKIGSSNWYQHIGSSDSVLVNASTWALMLTGKVLSSGYDDTLKASFAKIIRKSGEPIIRQALTQGMQILGNQFVMASNIDKAITKSKKESNWHYSFDMLGEAAYTAEDAEKYYHRYRDAITKISKQNDLITGPGISIKLSALHPRYEFTKEDRAMLELLPKVHTLCKMAKENNMGLCIDAEEADRLDLSLKIIEKLCNSKDLSGWKGFGFAIQAYQKRALSVISWAAKLAKSSSRKLMLRLVKGAYWDFEIKHAQEMGHMDYPVFTSKANTDVSYLACVHKLFEHSDYIYPCFATHNARTLSYILECTKKYKSEFEFQRLHGMGETLYKQIDYPCRVYAPIGEHEDLLSYLIRRLLENGANSSFINQVHMAPISKIIKDPIFTIIGNKLMRNEKIPLPIDIFGSARKNSTGIEIENPIVMKKLIEAMKSFDIKRTALPILDGVTSEKNGLISLYNPADSQEIIGNGSFATPEDALLALSVAHDSFPKWNGTEKKIRAGHLEKIADLYEKNKTELITILVKETGKVISDAISEVREAIDFLRYYAIQAKKTLSKWQDLPGITGESNKIRLVGRGVFMCISPWNFPLAIFTGQIAAALVTGNTVLAKPSEQSFIIGFEAVKLMHEGGIPRSVLHYLPGDGKMLGNTLLADNRISGVAFTGSTATAHIINRKLAERDCAISPLIAETGGINAMIVDSSALTEQVTKNVIQSAFHSAGQRCSALRVLFLQEEIADKQIKMIIGAMKELEIGDPAKLNTDVGPIIDKESLSVLQKYTDKMDKNGKLLARMEISSKLKKGYFFPPCIYETKSISKLEREAFGPILHIVRYKKSDLDNIINEINATGYGLTFSIQSRINANIEYITKKITAGNIYINRNQIGAVVESQPFGGSGLSGTGPKTGGPRYLYRFCTEQVITTDTTASGGNADLLNL
ncbi:MAG: bifunctional proline dehydrogenase/L-glutamate gamma-semialdehyde dehydrogenase PutA [Rickettsiaceae bacterium H1]|nr:bifunctional proline dehydrogenase/L-glutamate gamma-semialdehyde dehydrogenase PutA [Rickettsiaceae bacterium H1]